MRSRVPDHPQLYHITHLQNLASISGDGYIWSHGEVERRGAGSRKIGMDRIKAGRLHTQTLSSHAGLPVGECVPFNFCPRSVMLHVIHTGHPDLAYRGGQKPVVHLQVDMPDAIDWARSRDLCWAFTTSNAGAEEFDDYNDLAFLDRIDWDVVLDPDWRYRLRGKTFEEAKAARQAEFLVEIAVPWSLVRRIGVCSQEVANQARAALDGAEYVPDVEVQPTWYY